MVSSVYQFQTYVAAVVVDIDTLKLLYYKVEVKREGSPYSVVQESQFKKPASTNQLL